MREQKFIIGGEWRTGGETTAVRDVYNNSGLALVHQAGEQDIEDAIQAAQRAFVRTSQYSGFERSEILRSVAAQIKERKEEFARCITAEAGKPITFSRSEVDRAVLTFEIASEEAKRIYGETIPLDISRATMGKHGIVNSFPIGIILCITPFNFPLNLVYRVSCCCKWRSDSRNYRWLQWHGTGPGCRHCRSCASAIWGCCAAIMGSVYAVRHLGRSSCGPDARHGRPGQIAAVQP